MAWTLLSDVTFSGRIAIGIVPTVAQTELAILVAPDGRDGAIAMQEDRVRRRRRDGLDVAERGDLFRRIALVIVTQAELTLVVEPDGRDGTINVEEDCMRAARLYGLYAAD